MQRTLVGSVLLSLARTTLAARAGPSSRTFAFASTSNRSYIRSYGEEAVSLRGLRTPQRSLERYDHGLGSDRKAFSSGSISRYVDDLKEGSRSRSIEPGKTDGERYVGVQNKEVDPHSTGLQDAIDRDKPPEGLSVDSSSSNTSPPHSSTSGQDTTPNPNSSPALLDRLRSATSKFPRFDGLTSSESLTDALALATTHTRTLLSHLRTKLSHLSSQYNTHTGYTAIEELKSRIHALETSLDSARSLAATAKKTYLISVQSRSASQRETNDLLSRKNTWSESDLSRYTELLRKEHALSREEAEAEKVLEKTEAQVQACFDELMKAVMVRYHEEQIWSDRMRGMSTYGSLLVAGLNAFLFILAILLVEPYKRKKLAETFERRLVSAEEQSRVLILQSVEGFQRSLDGVLADKQGMRGVEGDVPPPLVPPQVVREEEEVGGLTESVGVDQAPTLDQRFRRQEEERLVFASTVGVVVGAALSLLISACWT